MTRNRAAIKIAAITNFLATVVVSCGLMLWGAFNFGTNIMEYRKSVDATASWGIAFGIIVVTCVVPILVGLWMLIRATRIEQPSK